MNCGICLEKILYLEIDTSCGHFFHQDCLETWLYNFRKTDCPLCRKKITFKRKGVQTRSKTEYGRQHKSIKAIILLVQLWEMASTYEDKEDVLIKVLRIIYNNHSILKKERQFWIWLKNFKKTELDHVEKYKKLINLWKIKFESK